VSEKTAKGFARADFELRLSGSSQTSPHGQYGHGRLRRHFLCSQVGASRRSRTFHGSALSVVSVGLTRSARCREPLQVLATATDIASGTFQSTERPLRR